MCGGLDYPLSSTIRPVPSHPPSSSSSSSIRGQSGRGPHTGTAPTTVTVTVDNYESGSGSSAGISSSSGSGSYHSAEVMKSDPSDDISLKGRIPRLNGTSTSARNGTNVTPREVIVVCVGPFIGQLPDTPPVSVVSRGTTFGAVYLTIE